MSERPQWPEATGWEDANAGTERGKVPKKSIGRKVLVTWNKIPVEMEEGDESN